jgi:hypothetical protein
MAFPGKATCFGSTAEEACTPLPGDELVLSPFLETTHAITINAPPQQIWPWLTQIGQERAGFYSDSRWWDAAVDSYYRLLSREQGRAPVGYRVHNGEKIVPAWQVLRVGDVILDGPPGSACYVVRQIEPNRSLVLFTDTHLPYLLPARLRDDRRLGISGELSDSFLLIPLEQGGTRVLRRMRAASRPWAFRVIVLPIVLIWGEMITARNFLRGLKRRSESGAGA